MAWLSIGCDDRSLVPDFQTQIELAAAAVVVVSIIFGIISPVVVSCIFFEAAHFVAVAEPRSVWCVGFAWHHIQGSAMYDGVLASPGIIYKVSQCGVWGFSWHHIQGFAMVVGVLASPGITY